MRKDRRSNTHRPPAFDRAHHLVMALHDVLLHQVVAGDRGDAWMERIEGVPPGDLDRFESSADAASWVLDTQDDQIVASFLSRTVYQALLRDALHYVFEAMECCRKGKLTVAFTLLRKPLNESLFVLEMIAVDPVEFARRLRAEVPLLDAKREGWGKPVEERVAVHAERIARALALLPDHHGLDADYLAQLRYGRGNDDSFAGTFDMSIHLVTQAGGIKTDPLNLNFIFSDGESLLTQWSYIYSRLPYIMVYLWRLSEVVFSRFLASDPVYMDDIERRAAAMIQMWAPTIPDRYRADPIDGMIDATRAWLHRACRDGGYRHPSAPDLERMAATGAWPGESTIAVKLRSGRYWFGSRFGIPPSRPRSRGE